MTDTGTVQNVTQQPLGSELADAVHAGGTVLTIHDAADFAEGDMVRIGAANTINPPNTSAETTHEASTINGMIRVGGDDPAAEIVHYLYVVEPDEDDDEDEDAAIGLADSWTGAAGGWGSDTEWDRARADWNARADDPEDIGPATITLDPATPITHAGGWPAGTRVDVWDPIRDEPATEWRAQVRPDSETANTDAIDAAVSFSLIPLLPEGTRTEQQAELVIIDDSSGDWRVIDVPGRYPQTGGIAQSGSVLVHTTGGAGTMHVDFDPPFRTPPLVVCSGHNAHHMAYAVSVDETGFDAGAQRIDGLTAAGQLTISWIAVTQ